MTQPWSCTIAQFYFALPFSNTPSTMGWKLEDVQKVLSNELPYLNNYTITMGKGNDSGNEEETVILTLVRGCCTAYRVIADDLAKAFDQRQVLYTVTEGNAVLSEPSFPDSTAPIGGLKTLKTNHGSTIPLPPPNCGEW